MHDDRRKARRRAVGWAVAALVLVALFFAGMHLLSRVDLARLHGG